ncbi:MAG: ABC transporter ATP-binding protein [Peptococcaceae bacterium]|nr:ABC transporter ATP-binding protein [Peptococcaceae bacterium]
MQNTVIKAEQIHKSFGSKQVLQDISLEIYSGEIFGILGPSGCGKTTLIKILGGMLSATSGEVTVLNEKIPSMHVLRQIGYMAQSEALYLDLTARENLEFFGRIYGISKEKLENRMINTMQTVNLVNDLDRTVRSYSGGMKRRLSLAGTLLHEPKILILDEPTVGIDPVLRQSIWQELRALAQSGITIVLTTHVMDEAEKCTRLAMMREGKIIAQDTPKRLMQTTGTASIEDAFIYYGGGKYAGSGIDEADSLSAEA